MKDWLTVCILISVYSTQFTFDDATFYPVALELSHSPAWLSGLGVWFSLRVREVPGSNPGGNMEIGQNFKNLPVKYLVLWCLGVPSGSSLTPWRVFKISSNFNFLCSKKRRVLCHDTPLTAVTSSGRPNGNKASIKAHDGAYHMIQFQSVSHFDTIIL